MQEALPKEFINRISRLYSPRDRKAVLNATLKEHHGSKKSRLTTFRVNTLKSDPKSLLSLLQKSGIPTRKSPSIANAFAVTREKSPRLLDSEAYLKGKIYVQNWSSMIPPIVLDPKPGERVLDLSAAPGSKTCQMAALMENKGDIVAIDKDKVRLATLLKNLNQQGVTIAEVIRTDGRFYFKKVESSFDKVLLDAPCTTEGRIQVNRPETYYNWSLRSITKMAALQRALLRSGIRCLKPGGELVYSTCTYAPEENELVVQSVLSDPAFEGKLEVADVRMKSSAVRSGMKSWNDMVLDPSLKKCLRIIPEDGFEGFFICKLRRTE